MKYHYLTITRCGAAEFTEFESLFTRFVLKQRELNEKLTKWSTKFSFSYHSTVFGPIWKI